MSRSHLEDRAPGRVHVSGENNHGDGFKSPKDRVVGPLPNGRTLWLINGGDPNHLLSGMILQVYSQEVQVVDQTACPIGTGIDREMLAQMDPKVFATLLDRLDFQGIWVLNQKYGKTPQIIPFVHRVFHYKPSILGFFPLFLETSYNSHVF